MYFADEREEFGKRLDVFYYGGPRRIGILKAFACLM